MFSYKKYELVKALHESNDGYQATDSPFSEYDNVIGECYEKYFVAGCLYQLGDIKIPCFQCQDYYPPLGINDPCTYNDFENCSHCGFLGCDKIQP